MPLFDTTKDLIRNAWDNGYTYLFAALAYASLTTPASALDLNSFRAQHGRPALSMSATLAGLAYEQAHAMASRKRLDHANFRARVAGMGGGVHAENVAFGCSDEDCAIRMWSRSGGHRANMLRGDVSAYGIASATGENGRRYWALELGN
jgi:uncharacterized protein YkwD